MNDLKNDIKDLKKTIFKITEKICDSDSKNQTLAFKCFVQLALHNAIRTLSNRYEHHGVPSFFVERYIKVGDALIQYESKLENLDLLNGDALIDAVNQYNHIVKRNEPFLDILSLLAEEITISQKQATKRGQFMTPPDLAIALAELLKQEDVPKSNKICDFCVGYGALILASIGQTYKENPERVKELEVIVNDIDPFMCNVVALQVIANTVNHNVDIKELNVICSDVIKHYKSGDASFVIKYQTPKLVIDDIERIRKEKAEEAALKKRPVVFSNKECVVS